MKGEDRIEGFLHCFTFDSKVRLKLSICLTTASVAENDKSYITMRITVFTGMVVSLSHSLLPSSSANY